MLVINNLSFPKKLIKNIENINLLLKVHKEKEKNNVCFRLRSGKNNELLNYVSNRNHVLD